MKKTLCQAFAFGAAAVVVFATASSAGTLGSSAGKKIVGLDYYYNGEINAKGEYWHYTWENKDENPGFYLFGKVAESLGAKITSLKEAPTADTLKDLSVYIIVDPDNTLDNPTPNYISEPAISAVEDWVKAGGSLLLMGNKKDDMEFTNYNQLAQRFGITFNEVTWQDRDDKKLMAIPNPPQSSPLFKGVKTVSWRGTCTISTESPATPVWTIDGETLVATAKVGKGLVVAMPDPAYYNEYIDLTDNRIAATNLLKYLLR